MVRVSTLLGAAASVVLCFSAGAYAAQGGEAPGKGPEFPVGKSVEFQLMGTLYRVTRPTETPDQLSISTWGPDGLSQVGVVSLEEVLDTFEHLRKDGEILTDALEKGESLQSAISDVAQVEGFTPEELEQLNAATATAVILGEDEAKLVLDAEKLQKDQEKLQEDQEKLQEDQEKLEEDLKFLRGSQ